jgi:alpha-glucosidase (family GH31 glycosyl hydrolase)
MSAGIAQMLFHKQLNASGVSLPSTAKPGKLDLRLSAISPRVLHIAIAPATAPAPVAELGVVAHSGENLGRRRVSEAPIEWGRYRILVKEDPLRFVITDTSERVRQIIQIETDSTAIKFNLGEKPLFGLGEGMPQWDLRGTRDAMRNGQGTSTLLTAGSRVPIPWVMSPEGWGVFVGQPFGTIDLSGSMGIVQSPVASSTKNVYLVLGDSPAEVLRGYAELTGFPHLPPRWSLGYMQSHRTLASRDEVLGIGKTFREKKLPCDALIYLGTGFCPSGWNTGHGSFTFNSDVFPDPKVMIDEFHSRHLKVILHTAPPYDFHGKVTDTGSGTLNPSDAVPYWGQHVPVMEAGADGWWPDEGDLLPVESRLERNQMYWDGPLKVHPDRRPFALHRNGYAGLQRYGWLWSGDVDSTWKALAGQVQAGIAVGLSGIPYWGTDTGGFVTRREYTPELYVRWFQFSAFCPLFRSHGRAWKLHLPWGWDTGDPGPLEGAQSMKGWPRPEDLHNADVETICRQYLELRYRLLPYMYSAAEQTHRTGIPMMRALWLEWPEDEKGLATTDAFLWGEHMLVAPVVEQGATKRDLYLPQGLWWDFWTNTRQDGRRVVSRDVDLKAIPLYVRAGAVLPLGPVRQYADEPSDEPLTLQIYPGADGESTWFDDDGRSFRYQQGDFARMQCEWKDGSRTLVLTRIAGGRTLEGKKMRIRLADTQAERIITFAGHTMTVTL